MKRLKSYGDELGSSAAAGDKEQHPDRGTTSSSSHHRKLYLKVGPENGRIRTENDGDRDRDTPRRKRVDYNDVDGGEERDGTGSRGFRKRMVMDHEDIGEGMRVGGRKYHDLDAFDDRDMYRSSLRKREDRDLGDGDGFRGVRKRFEHGNDGFDRRKGFDRYRERDGSDRGGGLVSPRGGEREREREREREKERERDRMHRSQSFCVVRREIPKGFRSDRDRSKREDSVSSWRSFGNRSKREGNDEMKGIGVEKPLSSCSKGGGGGDGGSSRESLRSPQTVKNVRSPTWSKESKDSGGGESLMKTVKKSDGLGVESGGSSNAADIEEGELQPEPRPENEPESASKPTMERVEHEGELHVNPLVKLEVAAEPCQRMVSDWPFNVSLPEEKEISHSKEDGSVKKEQQKALEAAEDVIREAAKVTATCDYSDNVSGGNSVRLPEVLLSEVEDNATRPGQDSLNKDHPVCSAPVESKLGSQDNMEIANMSEDLSLASSQEVKLTNGIDLEVQADDDMPQPGKAALEGAQRELEIQAHALKDKGKGVVVCSPEDSSCRGVDTLIESKFMPHRDDGMEGPSTRGFDLFSICVGTKGNQANHSGTKHEKLTLEPLDLSLGLPNISPNVPSSNVAAAPNSPPHGRSIQSLATTFSAGTDCFTTSISFSGSQFIHNPSCSLTHNSIDCDFEQSVKSRPLFQGFDWQAHSLNDSKHNEVPVLPKVLPNANEFLHPSNASQVVFTGQPVPVQPGMPFVLDRSGSFKRQLSSTKARHSSDVRSPTQSAGSHDTRSEHGRDKKRATGSESASRLLKSSSQRDMQPAVAHEVDFYERILMLLVSEPVHTMSSRVREMSERAITCLKEHTKEMIEKEDRRGKLHALQEVLKNRSDLTLEDLSKSHHVQLEILVALKTGLTDFLQRAGGISPVDLAEILLSLKCRNLNCRSALPVDDCDCKFCSRKDGFCSSCMCLVCSKFDTASNTCSWVGCDTCSHWCHTDCGLQNSFIRNGCRVATSQGTSEMQFYCVACNHPSEMYGFVTDVFKLCASGWNDETMMKELEYVKRIFRGSNDTRGKMLHDHVTQLLATLQNGSSVAEVRHQIMAFLTESESKFINASGSSGREPHAIEKNKWDGGNTTTGLSAEALGFRSLSMKNTSMTESARAPPPLNTETSGSRGIWDSDDQRAGKNNKPVTATSGSRSSRDAGPSMTGKNIPVMDELEGIVKIKLAEAEMFQKRADNARGEAEGLRSIALAKHKKAEEEYTTRIMKLRLGEAEERRRQKLEELQILERSHREFSNMKSRMEADIKLLFIKMEATKRDMRT